MKKVDTDGGLDAQPSTPRPMTPQGISEQERRLVRNRLKALLDARGWDAHDVAFRVGVGLARAQTLCMGALPSEDEAERIRVMLDSVEGGA